MKTNTMRPTLGMFFLQLLMIAFLFFSALIHYSGIPNGLIESKAYFFVVGAAPLIMIGCLQIARAAGKQVVVFNGIDIAYTAYTFFILVNSIAWQQALDEMLMVQVSSLFVYWLLKNLFLQAKDNHWLSIGLCLPFLLIGLAQAAYGLLQLYGYYPSLHSGFKLTGAFHNPGPFGVFLVSSFAFALGWYFFAEVNSSYKIFLRCVCIAVCVAVVLVLPATQSRTAWAACAASSALLLWYKYDIGTYWVKLKSRKVFLVAFIVVITSSLISVLVLAYQFKAASAAGRLVTWQISMRMVSDEPLFGHGFGSFAHRYGNYQADYFAVHPDETSKIQVADKVEYAFNDYLQILIEQGAVGFALFVGVIFFVFKSVPWQHLRRQPLLLASIASWMAVLVSGLFSYPFELAPTWFNFVFLLSIISAQVPNSQFIISVPRLSTVAAVTIMIAVSALVIYDQWRIFRAKQQWFVADQSMQYENYSEAVEKFKKVDSDLPREGNMLLSYGKALLMAGNAKQAVEVLERAAKITADPFLYSNLGEGYRMLKQYSMAEQAYQQASNMVPNRLYPKYLLAKMYVERGDTLMAQGVAKAILNTKEKIESPATREMKEDMRKIINP